MRTANRSARGHYRPAWTSAPRIIATAAPAGRWFESGDEARPANATDSPTLNLSPFTRRLVEALDEDFDLRFWRRPGLGIDAILMRAAAGDSQAASGEVLIDNVASAEMLGRLPELGAGLCDALKWRSDKLGRCIEMAATYEHCGKSEEMQRRLRTQCVSDWQALVREGLRATMVAAMREKSCTSLRKLVSAFRNEPFASDLPERKEIEALEQYTCAIEAREKVKAAAPAVLAGRDCRAVQALLVEHGQLLEPDMLARLRSHAKSVCCPEFGTAKECITRATFTSRVIAKLEERGCPMGSTREAKMARAANILEQINTRNRLVADLSGNGSLVDPLIEAVGNIAKSECTCREGEVLDSSGACSCPQFRSQLSGRCIDRAAAMRSLQEGLTKAGCEVGSASAEPPRRFIARLRHLTSTVKDATITSASFPHMEAALHGGTGLDRVALCAEFVVSASLTAQQRKVLERVSADHGDRPFAAIAVASACTGNRCEWAAVAGEANPEEAQAKALAACRKKSGADCVVGAIHQPAGKP